MPDSFLNKTIIIIGAGSSVGKFLSKQLHEKGANLHVTFRSEEKYNSFRLQNSVKYKLDLENKTEVSDFTKTISKNISRLDGIVFCSGTDISSPLKLTPAELIEKSFQVNLFSLIDISKHLLFTRKIDVNGASVVYLSSVAASKGFYGKSVYSAYKGALVSFARSLATEVSDRKIRINTISPGTFVSDMSGKVFTVMDQQKVNELENTHPLGFGLPEDVAHAVIFLLSEKSRWITGSDFIIDGGLSLR